MGTELDKPTTASEPKNPGKRSPRSGRIPWPAALALAGLPLLLLLPAIPALQRYERVGQDARQRFRYVLHSWLKRWGIAGAPGNQSGLGGDPCPDVGVVGIDGPSLAALGKYGTDEWLVREPFRRMIPIFQSVFVPSVAAYDILFRPSVGTAEGGAGNQDALSAKRMAALAETFRRAAKQGPGAIDNQTLLCMTRIAAIRGDMDFAVRLGQLSDPENPKADRPVPVILAYDFKGLDAPTQRRWSAADIVGADPSDRSLDNGEAVPYLLDVRIPQAQVKNVPPGYRYLPYAQLPSPVLRDYALHGFINVPRDPDGIIRRVPVVLGFSFTNPLDGKTNHVFVPSFALLAALCHWGLTPAAVHVDFHRGVVRVLDAAKGIDRRIPIDRQGRMYLNFLGRLRDYPNVPLITFLNVGEAVLARERRAGAPAPGAKAPAPQALEIARKIIARALDHKIVMIALTAAGTTDIGPCPVDTQTPYVHIHMTAADDILTGRFLRPVGPMIWSAVFAVLFLFLFFAGSRLHVGIFTVAAGALAGLYLVFTQLSIQRNLYVLPILAPMLYLFLGWGAILIYRYFTEERARKAVRAMFSTMVSPQVLTYLEEHPESFSLTGHRALVTVQFSDLAGFTSISEKLSPDELTAVLNAHLSAMTDIIMEFNGFVDKYEGDAIMAEWGVPYPNPRHARDACLAALEQQAALKRLLPEIRRDYGIRLAMRIGMNSGPVSAGNMGSNRRFQYTVMGDTVNQAARFEPANKDYGTEIMIGAETARLAGDAVDVRLLDKLVVVGKTEPVEVYELLAPAGETPRPKAEAARWYEEALKRHWHRQWEKALECLDKALAAFPDDSPSRVLQRRILEYRDNPPPENWDGRFVRTRKE